jgi:hypothetical protein
MAAAYPLPYVVSHGLKIVGPLLMEVPQDSILARYENRQWHFDGRRMSSFECNGRVMLHFQDSDEHASEAFGPFTHLSFPNGCCYADHRLFAELTGAAARWRHLRSRKDWQMFMIASAEESRTLLT